MTLEYPQERELFVHDASGRLVRSVAPSPEEIIQPDLKSKQERQKHPRLRLVGKLALVSSLTLAGSYGAFHAGGEDASVVSSLHLPISGGQLWHDMKTDGLNRIEEMF